MTHNNARLANEARPWAIAATPRAIPPLQVTPHDRSPHPIPDSSWSSTTSVDEMTCFCPDCGIDAWGFEEDGQIVHEDFYVSNTMWDAVCPDDEVVRWDEGGRQFGMGHFVMCIGCFEKRLGRRLTRADLRSGPALNVANDPPSKRFADRWESP